jgi:hypothetical protein
MKHYRAPSLFLLTILVVSIILPSLVAAREVVRPEEIKSKRQVIYDQDTYVELTRLWQEYHDAYPSEYAYANWMYAARYAGDAQYSNLLAKGVDRYAANPTLLYLKSMEVCDLPGDMSEAKFLERAIAADPGFTDAWFSLAVHYMEDGQQEKNELALRHLLESGVITDEVMDYNYNVLTGLEENAILVTNGDNDTYPAWILTSLLGHRPDVSIVNRSMLNTAWYPMYLIDHGLPHFISQQELTAMHAATSATDAKQTSYAGPFADVLVNLIVKSAERAGRPVYLAKTMYITEDLTELAQNGRELGLATLVTPSDKPYSEQLQSVFGKWVESFRTAGLDSWRLHNSNESDAGRRIVPNYAAGLAENLAALKQHAPALRGELFGWYRAHVEDVLNSDWNYRFAHAWCQQAGDVDGVESWCRSMGLTIPGDKRP